MIDEFGYLESLNENRIEMGLDRIKKVLQILGNIQNDLKIIHIAGTNGKGSTSNLINNILLENCLSLDAKKIGLFTSPHITKINERIKINNQEISDDDLKKYINYFRMLLQEHCIQLTYFEFLTVIAIKYFCDNFVKIAIFECGLGGRLDSTNVFEKPLVTVITNIDFDHTEYLGSTLPDILTEKMGIFRSGVPVVAGLNQDELKRIIEKKAEDFEAKLFLLGKDFWVNKKRCHSECNEESRSFASLMMTSAGQNEKNKLEISNEPTINSLCFESPSFLMDDIKLKIRGEHQQQNLAIALIVLQILRQTYGYKFKSELDIKNTINNFEFGGRLEFIKTEENKVGVNFLLDVGHNLAGIKTCVRYLQSIKKDYKNLVIVFGMLKDKDYANSVMEILKVGDFFYLTSPKSKRALEIDDVLKEFARHKENKKVKLASQNYEEILSSISRNFGNEDLICVVGSFYLIADFKKNILEGN